MKLKTIMYKGIPIEVYVWEDGSFNAYVFNIGINETTYKETIELAMIEADKFLAYTPTNIKELADALLDVVGTGGVILSDINEQGLKIIIDNFIKVYKP